MKFYRNQEIEELAAERLAQLAQVLGRQLTPPIPIDLLNRSTGDSYTRRSRHVEITRLYELPSVPMS